MAYFQGWAQVEAPHSERQVEVPHALMHKFALHKHCGPLTLTMFVRDRQELFGHITPRRWHFQDEACVRHPLSFGAAALGEFEEVTAVDCLCTYNDCSEFFRAKCAQEHICHITIPSPSQRNEYIVRMFAVMRT